MAQIEDGAQQYTFHAAHHLHHTPPALDTISYSDDQSRTGFRYDGPHSLPRIRSTIQDFLDAMGAFTIQLTRRHDHCKDIRPPIRNHTKRSKTQALPLAAAPRPQPPLNGNSHATIHGQRASSPPHSHRPPHPGHEEMTSSRHPPRSGRPKLHIRGHQRARRLPRYGIFIRDSTEILLSRDM